MPDLLLPKNAQKYPAAKKRLNSFKLCEIIQGIDINHTDVLLDPGKYDMELIFYTHIFGLSLPVYFSVKRENTLINDLYNDLSVIVRGIKVAIMEDDKETEESVKQWKPTNTPRKPDCYPSAAFIRIMTITGKSFNFLQTMAVRGSRSIRCIKVWRLMISDFCASLTVRKNTVWSPLHMPDTTLVFREKNNPFLYTYAICWMKSNRPAWFWHIWAAGDVGIRLWIASLDEMYI